MLQSMLTPKIRSAIAQYTANHLNALDADHLLPGDWELLDQMATFLEQLKVIIKVTEGGNASLADVLPGIDFVLDAFSNELTKAEEEDNLPLAARVKCGWETLDKYFNLTDRAPVYVAAVVPHTQRTWQYFDLRWKEEWIVPAKRAVEALWKEEYKAAAVPALNSRMDNHADDVNLNPFELWLSSSSTAQGGVPVPPDEYQEYCAMGPETSFKDAPAAIACCVSPASAKDFPAFIAWPLISSQFRPGALNQSVSFASASGFWRP
jgi:hypothetical protein